MKRSQSFPERTPSVPHARRFVADSLDNVPPETIGTITLLVSELATNAVVHASSGFEVTVIYPTASGRIRVEVSDRDRTRPTPLQPPPNVPRGRGLQLVSALSDDWGVQDAATGEGKCVWFELAIPTAATLSTPR